MAAPDMSIWRHRVTTKRYRCSQCGRVFPAETNHWGVIYRGCASHHYGAHSECVEAEEALKDLANR